MSKFKIYEETWCGVKYFVRYMGAEVEGQCKWYIWSNDIDLNQYDDTLLYTKEDAVLTARNSISLSKTN